LPLEPVSLVVVRLRSERKQSMRIILNAAQVVQINRFINSAYNKYIYNHSDSIGTKTGVSRSNLMPHD